MKLLHACKMFHVVVKPADDMVRPRLSFDPGSRISTHQCIKAGYSYSIVSSSPLPTPHSDTNKQRPPKPPTNNLTVLNTTKTTTYNGSYLHRQDL
jgi:hypothetical protein